MFTKVLLVLAVLFVMTNAQASIISGTLTGTVGDSTNIFTIDFQELFGPAYADLRGRPFTLSYQYNTADFANPPVIDRSRCYTLCTTYYSSTLSSDEFIAFTVNGITQRYTPSYYSYVDFETIGAPYPIYSFSLGIDTPFRDSLFSGRRAAVLGFTSASPFAFGETVTPTGNGGTAISLVTYFGRETLNLTLSPTAVTPEPSTLSLVASGFLLACGALKRRFA